MHKKVIKIATGSKNGAYYSYALLYQEALKKEGIELIIVPTKGSVEAQKKLLNQEVDFAFVQGGTENPKVLALANIAYEPIWIFYKDTNITNLGSLEGKRIAVGEQGSGINPIAMELLDVVGIDENKSQLYHLSSSDAFEKLKKDEIDVMFYIASANAVLVEKLIKMPEIHLMNFEASSSYRQYFIKRNQYYEIVELKESAFDMKKKIPKEKYLLLSKTTLLATYNSSEKMLRLLLKVANDVHSKVGMFHHENEFPNASMLKMEQAPASKHYFQEQETYLETHMNFWLAQTLNNLYIFSLMVLLPLVTLFAFFIEVIIPVYTLYTRRKINAWYYTVNDIDTGIEKLDLEELKEKRKVLEEMLLTMRATEEIPAIHMEAFYTLQNQVVNILDELNRKMH
ncbi:ABC transporter substrate-binding protein [bacterium]|nr:ABC transporter substrate-binding protein [bacterium]MBU1957902.1 ABC transporter substrate-binding protein [bacterium]